MTRRRSPEALARYRAAQRAYSRANLRKRTPEEDFMRNLLDMGTPSSIMELVDSVHPCLIGPCHNQTTIMLCWPHWEPVTLCKRHEQMRRARRTK